MTKYILTISNRGESMYEIYNIISKREVFYIVTSIEEIIMKINERYNTKEDKTIVAKIVNLDTTEQLTIQYCLDSVNAGTLIRITHPTLLIEQNTKIYKSTDVPLPLNYNDLMNYDHVKHFFN